MSDPKLPEFDDVEITPEMIEAGAEAIWAVLSDVIPYGSGAARELASEVFQAMGSVQNR